MTDLSPSPWWDAQTHADRRPILLARNRITAALRGRFREHDFVEVETPTLQVSPGNETHLHALPTRLTSPDGREQPLYLHTSPEFACKSLIAAGEPRIVTFARVFRDRERGALHHPEFTMLEWYRANETYETLMADCAAVLTLAADAAGTRTLRFRDRTADPYAQPERLSVAEAFLRHAKIDLLATLDGTNPDVDALRGAATSIGIRTAADDTWSDIFSRILSERVEGPIWGLGRPTILDEYPICEAALARPASDPRVAERFELYACGVELANAFGELTDPTEQQRRFEHAMAEKQRIYGTQYPIDPDFLQALAAMPPAAGIALGLDRLVMLATGASRIDQVLWAPVAG